MGHPPIPTRIPPLSWRKPAFLMTPLALAAAIGWPALLFRHDGDLQKLSVIVGAAAFALALITLGMAWAVKKAPRTRRDVVGHVVRAGVIAALAAPFVLTTLLAGVANYEQDGAGSAFTFDMAVTMLPLSLLLALPISAVSGIVFSLLALAPGKPDQDALIEDRAFDSQPFR